MNFQSVYVSECCMSWTTESPSRAELEASFCHSRDEVIAERDISALGLPKQCRLMS